MSNTEGIPDGWELVRVGIPDSDDWLIGHDGNPVAQANLKRQLRLRQYAIIRKIEKPKTYRAFANAAEFAPHRDRWVEYISPNRDDYSMYRISGYSSQRVWLGPNASGIEYREAFHCLKFTDGSPFGVEVTE